MIKIIKLTLIYMLTISVCYKNAHAQQNVEKHSSFCNAKSAKIIVSQSYGEADKVGLPFKRIMARLLQYDRIKEDTVNYDLIVRINANGSARGHSYLSAGFKYTGASLEGYVIFESIAINAENFTVRFKGEIEPPTAILMPDNHNSPNDAPFMDAFYKALPALINSIYKPLGITPLNAALKDKDVKFRVAVANALGIIQDSSSVEPLIAALKNNDDQVREAAAEALGNIKDSRAVESLIGALKDKGFENKTALNALDKIDPNWRNTEAAMNAVLMLINALKDKGFDNEAKLNALDKIDPNWRNTEAAKSAVPMIIVALKDKDVRARQLAAYALANLKDSRAVEPLIATLKDINTMVRQSAAYALGNIKDSRAVKPLIVALKDKDARARQLAAYALANLKDSRAVEPLIATLKDINTIVRQSAAYALGNIKDSRAVKPLILALKDEDSSVCNEAEIALDNIDPNWRNKYLTSP
jgi:HEAT repeat protein